MSGRNPFAWSPGPIERMTEGYFVEHNGDCWQSVFPPAKADESALHGSIKDAVLYMISHGVEADKIKVIPRKAFKR